MVITLRFSKQLFISSCLALKNSRGGRQSMCTSSVLSRNFRSPVKFTKYNRNVLTEDTENSISEGEDKNDSFRDENIDELLDRTHRRLGSGHQVFVIQPFIKWGPKKKRNTTPQLQLHESVTLIKTLREWKVVGETIISLRTFDQKYFFGKGNLAMIKDLVDKCPQISAVFISVNTLSLMQQSKLQESLGVPVFDRYTIIMHIFREHANSKEAKLQIQLAELPYLWMVMKGMNIGVGENFGGSAECLGGYQPRTLEYRREVFKQREGKIKRAINQLREERERLRKIREEKEIPVVAVLGYTNAGKTSLIKALTGKESLEPQDYLFATLDVTCHLGKLPSNLKVNYVDTLGFISDIPTYLIESFVSTLEDATSADVIIHVRDISHPDTIAQNDNVKKVLQDLNLSQELLDNIITVGNKIDRLNEADLKNFKDENIILVSCTKQTGIDVLKEEIEKKILSVVNKIPMTIRVVSGGEEYDWLHLNTTVAEEVPDPKDYQYVLMKVIISHSTLGKFKHQFIQQYKKR